MHRLALVDAGGVGVGIASGRVFTRLLLVMPAPMEIPDTIACIDCGQTAHRLTAEPEFGFEPGDWVAYRCSGCGDRWDMEVAGEPDAPGAERN